MAGLAVAAGPVPGWAAGRVADLVRGMLHSPQLVARTWHDDHAAIALVLPRGVTPTWWEDTPGGVVGAVHGEHLAAGDVAADARAGAWDRLRNRNGLYTAVAWDPAAGSLAIANDATGALLLFRTREPGGRVWCSEPGPLGRPGEPDPLGLESLVRIGYQADGRTGRTGIDVLPAATTEVFAPGDGGHREHTALPDAPPHSAFATGYVDVLRDAVASRLPDLTPSLLPLTGGEDSRILLAVARDLGVPVTTVTLDGGQRGDAEVAARVAAAAGVDTTRVPIDPAALDRHRPLLTAALGTTTDWHMAQYLPMLAGLGEGRPIVLGFLGGTLAGAGVHRRSAAAGLAGWRGRALEGFGAASDPPPDLPWAQVPAGAAASPPELLTNLYGRQRRYVGALVRLAWNFGRPVCPFADRRLVDLALGATRRELAGQDARRAAVARAWPRLAALPLANDGLPLAAARRRSLRRAARRTGIGRLARRLGITPGAGFDYERLQPLAAAALAPHNRPELRRLPPLAQLAVAPLLDLEDPAVVTRVLRLGGLL